MVAVRIMPPRRQDGGAVGSCGTIASSFATTASNAGPLCGAAVSGWPRNSSPAAASPGPPPPTAPPAPALTQPLGRVGGGVVRSGAVGEDRLPAASGQPTTQRAIRPPQPRLSSSGCGARIRQVPLPMISSRPPTGRRATPRGNPRPCSCGHRRAGVIGEPGRGPRSAPRRERAGADRWTDRGRSARPGCPARNADRPMERCTRRMVSRQAVSTAILASPTVATRCPVSAVGSSAIRAAERTQGGWFHGRSSPRRCGRGCADCRTVRRFQLIHRQSSSAIRPPSATAEPRHAPAEKSGSRR